MQKISIEDFSLDSQSSKNEAVELRKTLEHSLADFAKKIDTINFVTEETKLRYKLASTKIYSSQNLKLSCEKLRYSPIVPNYYDTAQNIIYYSGHWNSISNAKLVEYLFKAFELSESQISKDEFVSIILKNIPPSDNFFSNDVASPVELGVEVASTGRLGEEFVYRDLVSKFGKERVIWLNEGGETYHEYDFEILNHDGNVIYYVDAKATTTSEISSNTVPIYITKSEWKFMQDRCEENYIIARVYQAKSSNSEVKYFNISAMKKWKNLNSKS